MTKINSTRGNLNPSVNDSTRGYTPSGKDCATWSCNDLRTITATAGEIMVISPVLMKQFSVWMTLEFSISCIGNGSDLTAYSSYTVLVIASKHYKLGVSRQPNFFCAK